MFSAVIKDFNFDTFVIVTFCCGIDVGILYIWHVDTYLPHVKIDRSTMGEKIGKIVKNYYRTDRQETGNKAVSVSLQGVHNKRATHFSLRA